MISIPFTVEGFEGRRAVMSSESKPEIYPSIIARSFGYIENIIYTAFKDKVPAQEVVKRIEDVLEKIKDNCNE
jgi:hypothetical protein